MKSITEIINEISDLSESLKSNDVGTKISTLLKDSAKTIDVLSTAGTKEISEEAGLYYFEAQFPFTTLKELHEFGNEWGRHLGQNLPSGVSRYYKSRANKQKELLAKKKYIPFYLGKSENIKKRIITHITGSNESTTYSLKTKSRPNLIQNINFRLGTLSLDINTSGYFCIELLEKNVRELLNPIIGKQ